MNLWKLLCCAELNGAGPVNANTVKCQVKIEVKSKWIIFYRISLLKSIWPRWLGGREQNRSVESQLQLSFTVFSAWIYDFNIVDVILTVFHSMRFNLSEIIRLPSSTANLCNSKLQHRRCASAKPLKMQMQIESVRNALHTWRRELVPLLCIFIALFCFSFRRYLLANLPITRCVRLNSSHWCWRLLNYIWIFVVVAKTQRLAEYPSIGCISRTYLTHTIGSSFALASLAILAICSQSPWLIDELEQCALCASRQCRHSIHFIVYFNSKRR